MRRVAAAVVQVRQSHSLQQHHLLQLCASKQRLATRPSSPFGLSPQHPAGGGEGGPGPAFIARRSTWGGCSSPPASTDRRGARPDHGADPAASQRQDAGEPAVIWGDKDNRRDDHATGVRQKIAAMQTRIRASPEPRHARLRKQMRKKIRKLEHKLEGGGGGRGMDNLAANGTERREPGGGLDAAEGGIGNGDELQQHLRQLEWLKDSDSAGGVNPNSSTAATAAATTAIAVEVYVGLAVSAGAPFAPAYACTRMHPFRYDFRLILKQCVERGGGRESCA